MPTGLKRYQQLGDLHFVTFSCYHRLPYLMSAEAKHIFEHSLEAMRGKYGFCVAGYVIMPEHVHLLLTEPHVGLLAIALQALKISVSMRLPERPFWQRRYYDFNVFSEAKRVEKLRYMHRNPVARGLARAPQEWLWSSFNHYATGGIGTVEIESPWTMARREGLVLPDVQTTGHGAAFGVAQIPHLRTKSVRRYGAPKIQLITNLLMP
jgi:putative transposase